MPKFTLDAELAKKLNDYRQGAELCDPMGKVIGRFVPAFDPAEWEILGTEISEEELDRRSRSDKWHTTEEVLAHLHGLDPK